MDFPYLSYENNADIPHSRNPGILWSKVFSVSPKIIFFEIQILIVGFFQNHLLIGKFQEMISLMKFVIPLINKILLSLWFAVIAVRHHQIPVNIL